MKPDIEQLKDALKLYDGERYKLSNLIRELEEVPKAKALVGKYFKYRNSYNVNERWWMFFHVKYYQNNFLIVDMFEEDNRSKIEFVIDKQEYGTVFYNPSYTEINKKEYEAAAKTILKKLKKNFQ